MKLLESGTDDLFELRQHPCGHCGCILRRCAKHGAAHVCHDKQWFIAPVIIEPSEHDALEALLSKASTIALTAESMQ